MSDDWPQGWYQNEKPNAGEPTRDAPIQGLPVPSVAPASGTAATGTGATGTVAGRRLAHAAPAQRRPGRTAMAAPARGRQPGPGAARPARRRRWLRPKRILLVLAALVLVLVVAVGFIYVNVNGKLNRVNVLTAYSGRPTPGAGTNWLITGSDSRGGLTRGQEAAARAGPQRRWPALGRRHDLAHPGQRDTARAGQYPA